MAIKSTCKVLLSLILIGLFSALSTIAQSQVPSPSEVIGFTPGDDRKLPSWNQVTAYFQKLEDTSPRVQFEVIGKTSFDRPFVYATISSPENLKNLEKYKQINAKLADPRLIKSDEKLAKQLIKEGKTIVLITFGIHSTEVGSNLSSMLLAYRLASSNEPEIKKILDETIILVVPSLNPDGVDIVKNWYDKTLGTPFEGTTPPELYHKYTGHDNNRDWYAFTQVETQLTVDKIHNVWHPQIVNDVHQQGANGARLFLPPYMQPVEPNVPKEIVEGYTELGNYIAASMRNDGFKGITTDSTYDAWTPARAYSHYHGGVRILSETASVRLASPINVPFDKLTGSEGYSAKKEAPNFGPLWNGGDWTIRDITNYMTTSSFALLKHAAANREKWLRRFYAIGKEAVRPKKKGELFALIVDPRNFYRVGEILTRAGVETQWFEETDPTSKKRVVKVAIPMNQPYADFAKAVLERQTYPNLLDEKGNPIAPYDVTAHSLSLLMDVQVTPVYQPREFPKPDGGSGSGSGGGSSCSGEFVFSTYRSYVPAMDEGWSRWTFETYGSEIPKGNYCKTKHVTTVNSDIKDPNLLSRVKTIVFPDQSPKQMLDGHAKGAMPDEYVGGIGKVGAANLRKFVEDGGTLVFLNRASDFAIQQFGLPLRDVTDGLKRKDFYVPGSILRTELDTTNRIARDMPKESIAWFEDSPAFELTDANATNIEIIARYPSDPKKILLSGWALGAEKIAGKAALVCVKLGKGKIYLFGFRPQYRGQSIATFPLLFNAIQSN